MCVSADTKTCGSPLNPVPAGVIRMFSGKHADILTEFQTLANKKMTKKEIFLAEDSVSKNNEIRTTNYEMSTDLSGEKGKVAGG